MNHFFIYKKTNETIDASHHRYFRTFDAAKAAMDKDVKDLVTKDNKIVKNFDYFNSNKGFNVYEKEVRCGKCLMSFAIIDGYFED